MSDIPHFPQLQNTAVSAPKWIRRVARTSIQLARQRVDPTGRTLPSPESLGPFVRRHSTALLRSLGIDVVTHGDTRTKEPADDECVHRRPILIVANHVSWIDPYVINSVFGARFVAKHDVAGWFVIGPIARRFGAFFHKRGCFRDAWRTVEATHKALRDGYRVGIFPEGTTTYGDHLLPFFPALFQAAIDSQALVQPVALRYQTAQGEPTEAAAYAGQMTFGESVRNILRAPEIVADLQLGPRLEPGDHRRDLATRTESAIDAMLWPERSGDERERPRPNWADLPENLQPAG